jgi:hypothetical protein
MLKEHSFSMYDLEMNNLANSKGEDLLPIIRGMTPAVVDNNSEWKARSLREPSRAFLLGRTIDNETPNLEGVFFNRKVQGGRPNVFLVALEHVKMKPVIVIHRLDASFKAVFARALPQLKEIPEAERLHWNDPVKRLELRNRVLEFVQIPLSLLLARISAEAPRCCGSFARSCSVAELSYTAMLVETARQDPNELQKFISNDENLFGDTMAVQEALLFGASILSKDQHLKRMCAYCGLQCIE